MNIIDLIYKILEYKSDSEIDEIKIDLKRVVDPKFGSNESDVGYVNYLYNHYSSEIQTIKETQINVGYNMTNQNISYIVDIRNWLIKIAVIRICKEKMIKCEIDKIEDIDYCISLLI